MIPRKAQRTIPTDAEATLERARLDALDILARNDGPATIHQASVKLPSGVKGERLFAMGASARAIFGGVVAYPIVETITEAPAVEGDWTPAWAGAR